ncbi:dispersed gene family protein 1 (DGF-1), partial [Trypanosoma cruzi]
MRNATNPFTVLELAVPVHRGYFIAADETLVIRCDAVAVFGGCRGVLLGSFTIRSDTLPAAASALSAITGVVAGAAAVAVVVTGGLGSVLEMQALGVFARMSCASAQERASTVALPYLLSVFAALDPLWMVVGNALLAAVFGCVHCGVTAAFQRWRGVDAASAWAAMRFPSLTYVVAHAMHLGMFFRLCACTGDARRPRAAPRDWCRWRAVRCGVPCWRVLLYCPPHGRELHEVLAVFEEAAARASAVPRRVLAPRGAAADVRRHADEHEGQPR